MISSVGGESYTSAEACRAAAEEARRKNRPKEERPAVDKWAAMGDPEAAAYHSWLQSEGMELFVRRQTEERHARLDDWPSPDERAVCARSYRNGWNQMWACQRGTYEDTTAIPAMRYTDVKPPAWRHVDPTGTLQIFSFKVAAIAEELQWPLDVYGLIAIRDHLDRNRNIIFARARDNCQTISLELLLNLLNCKCKIILLNRIC
ncbi:uncharacterized protein [Triticum aestivum]|uniref:uncharacterized protein n=1 Tax=Triticum aestivum TaxID=4565 RepID=UPI001D003D0D|nr:uncharacterized protein LOC123129393 [Triticum aestivum]